MSGWRKQWGRRFLLPGGFGLFVATHAGIGWRCYAPRRYGDALPGGRRWWLVTVVLFGLELTLWRGLAS